MRLRAILVIVTGLLAVSGATAQQRQSDTLLSSAAQPRDLVLEGGTLIDGTGRAPIANAVVVIEGARIKAVGRRGQVAIPAGARIINLAGRTILPGLIDGHLHIQEWQLPLFLHYGVTTIADMNNDLNWIIAQRDGQKRGLIKGPRLFVSGPTLWGNLHPQTGRTFNSVAVETPEQARARVDQLAAAGVDIIHVDDGLPDDVLRAVIAESDRLGLPATGHTQNILKAAEMGFKFEEHLDTLARGLLGARYTVPQRLWPPQAGFLAPPMVTAEAMANPADFPAAVALMVRDGVFLNPTIVVSYYGCTPRWQEQAAALDQLLKEPGIEFVPADVRKLWPTPPGRCRGGYDNMAEFLKEYSAAGGKIIIGTDTSGSPNLHVIPGLGVHNEMQMLADAGVPPMKVIQGATLWNAQMLKKDKDLGSIEPGKLADFAVIEGDPLTNMGATRNIRMVIQNGQVLDTQFDPNWVNPIPEPFSGDYRLPPVQITNLMPGMAPEDGGTVTVQIDGSGYAPGAVVRFDTTDLPTQFVSSTKLTATLDARLLQRHPGSYPLYVVDPGLHGTVSSPAYFVVNLKQ